MKKILLALLMIVSLASFGQVTLVNNGSLINIQYLYRTVDLQKTNITVQRQNNYVYIGIDNNYAEKILYSDVVAPVVANAVDLEDTVNAWINQYLLSLAPDTLNFWNINGNAGTVDGTSFIGTTDNIPLSFRVNNVLSGKIRTNNTSLGYQSFLNYAAGAGYNSFFGDNSGLATTTGDANTGIGSLALQSVSTGGYNTALGYRALSDGTGSNNIGLGHAAGHYLGALNNRLSINAFDMSDLAGDTTKSIIYGRMNPTGTNQSLYLNAVTTINQAYTFPAADGSANQVLATDGSGQLFFKNDSTGGGGSDSLVQVMTVNGWLGGSRIKETKCWDIDVAPTLIDSGVVTVYRGSYVADGNIAKENVTWICKGNPRILKTTAGAMFDCTGFTKPIRILGDGRFYKTTNAGDIITNTTATDVVFEFDICQSTIDDILYNVSQASKIIFKGNKASTAGGIVFYDNHGGSVDEFYIDVNEITSSYSYALSIGTVSNYVNVNSSYISGVGSTYYGVWSYYDHGTFDVTYCSGYVFATSVGIVTINGTAGYINNARDFIELNGAVRYLTNSGKIIGGSVGYGLNSEGTITNSGYADIYNIYAMWDKNTIVNTAGVLNINTITQTSSGIGTCNISGGIVRLNGNFTQYGRPVWYIPSEYNVSATGTLIINGEINVTAASWIINQTGGKVIINGTINNTGVFNESYNYLIQKTSGTLILNGSVLKKGQTYTQLINCPSSAQNIMIYAGGCTTNGTVGDLLSAKARKDSLIVSAVATTTIVLNDGSGGAETFTCLTCGPTEDDIASEMATLINGSGTLGITATYVSGHSFNIESDVAGTNYTQSGLVNLTNTQLRLNSYAITDLTGGTLIEDSDVTF